MKTLLKALGFGILIYIAWRTFEFITRGAKVVDAFGMALTGPQRLFQIVLGAVTNPNVRKQAGESLVTMVKVITFNPLSYAISQPVVQTQMSKLWAMVSGANKQAENPALEIPVNPPLPLIGIGGTIDIPTTGRYVGANDSYPSLYPGTDYNNKLP